MFGGHDGINGKNDTWEFDGAQWLQRNPLTVPNPVNSPQLAYDSARGVTVMVTGSDIANAPLALFEWNGIDWSARTSTTTGPLRRYGYSLAYDTVRQRTVMFGGDTSGNELWEWDGNAWHLMLPAAPISPVHPGMYFDPQRGVTVIVEGDPALRTAAFTWNGVALASLWSQRSAPVLGGFALFRDDVRNRTVMFGGETVGGTSSDTWEWDGLHWAQRSPMTTPPPRQRAMACFDPVTSTGLLFGGVNGTTQLADCWRWDGVNWTQLAGLTPSARSGGAMAWDSARNEAILFGGTDGNNALAETWRWNGTAWTRLNPATSPSARTNCALAFDPVHSRLLLFGGWVAGTYPINDTWAWNGAQWQLVPQPQAPPALLGSGMVHDPVRGRMLLVGAALDPQSQLYDLDAWEYDGNTWSLVSRVPNSVAGESHVVWDSVRQHGMVFDGWTIRELTRTPAAADVLGTGCGAPPPLLCARARPRTGENQFGLELATRPGLPALFALDCAPGSTPIGNGCMLLLQQVTATAFALAGGNGLAVQPIPLPANQTLRGLVLYAQAGALDPVAPGGLAFSASMRLTVGD